MSHEIILNGKHESKPSLLAKIYIWSIVLHPLLFFDFAHEELIGIGGNISKILELIVVICLFFSLIFYRTYSIILNPQYSTVYWVYTFYAIWVAFFGYFYGYYEFNNNIEYVNQGFFNLAIIRPFFEYIILIFYYFYFVVLAVHFLSSNKTINYFFKVFLFLFYSHLLLGFLDQISTIYFEFDLIPISLSRYTPTSWRFHGLAGEPRDAFVFLIFGIAMIYLYNFWKKQNKIKLLLPVTISIIALLMTASVSGMVGVIISTGLISAYQLRTFKLKNIFFAVLFSSIVLISVYLNFVYFSRLGEVLNALPALYYGLKEGNIPEGLIGQMPNIYPVFSRFNEVIELNLLPTIFGTGVGTESVVNVNMLGGGDLTVNPQSQIIRLFYSAGIVGTLLYIISFYYPVYKISKIYNTKIFIYILLFLLGANLGHRSIAIFIFLGVFMAVFKQLSKKP